MHENHKLSNQHKFRDKTNFVEDICGFFLLIFRMVNFLVSKEGADFFK